MTRTEHIIADVDWHPATIVLPARRMERNKCNRASCDRIALQWFALVEGHLLGKWQLWRAAAFAEVLFHNYSIHV